MKKAIVFLGMCLLSGVLAWGKESKGVSEITIQTGTVLSELKPYIINGVNVNNAMQILTIKKYVDKLGTVTITTPAGNLGDDRFLSEKDLDFFKTQQEYIGNPHTFMQVRLFEGTKDAAVNQLKYTRKIGLDVNVWTIGNEPDLYASHRGDASWTAGRYCREFREYVNAMKAVDPGLKFAGPVTSQPYDNWIKEFIYECGDIVDVLAWHWYPTDGKGNAEEALKTASQTKNIILKYKGWLKDPRTNPKGYKRHIQTGITEWAIHWNTPYLKFLTDMVGVLWSAEVLGYYMETGLDYSHYFCLNQYGGHALFNKINRPRLLYYLFVMYKEHSGKVLLGSHSGNDLVKVVATRKSEKNLSVFLINQDPSNAVSVSVKAEGMPNVRSAEAFELTDSIKYEKVSSKNVTVGKKGVMLGLKPYSVTVVLLNF
ncbi:MAG: hypothetical protein JW969_06955 [Spirochaetales bacterium]|nr:hypothetical protein [Spirochaetales bacterium]